MRRLKAGSGYVIRIESIRFRSKRAFGAFLIRLWEFMTTTCHVFFRTTQTLTLEPLPSACAFELNIAGVLLEEHEITVAFLTGIAEFGGDTC